MPFRLPRRLSVALVVALLARGAGAQTLVQAGSQMRMLANRVDPGVGLAWVQPGFDDGGWIAGDYGVGYELSPTGALNLFRAVVPSSSLSVYTRAPFWIDDPALVTRLLFGVDYDDGYVAFVNGVEVARAPGMPPGPPAWNASPASHESSNGTVPDYGPLLDVTAAALPALRRGANVLAVGAWNSGSASSDLVLVPKLVANPSPVMVTRGPYLQMVAPDRITVHWRTSAATGSRVRLRTALGVAGWSVIDPSPVTEHAVAVTGLAAATTYYYGVGTPSAVLEGEGYGHHFRTPAATGSAASFRAWVVGDSGTANYFARSVRNAYADHGRGRTTDLWLMLGDNAYVDGTDAEYQAAVFDVYPAELWRMPLFSTFGNHDAHSASSATETGPYYDIFDLPRAAESGGTPSGTEAYYSFDVGNVHFICLDSQGSSRQPGGPMLTWLTQDLLSTAQRFIVAFWHHPPYTKGSHDSDTESQLVEMRQNVLPLLEAGGVDLVLTGHSHSYERSFLVDGHYGASSTFGPANVVDGGDGRPAGDGAYRKATFGAAPHEGSVYAVAGSSGQTGGGPLDHPAMYVSLNVLGSMILDVSGDRIDATFIDAKAVVRDSFSIVKGRGAIVDLVTAPGPDPGAAPRVRGWSAAGQASASLDFSAYGTGGYGANVGVAQGDGVGTREILTGPGPSGVFGPQVRAFFTPSAAAVQKVNFYAYGTLRFGAHAEGGDLDGDARDEIVTGPGPGAVFGPHVRAFDWDGGTLTAMAKISFFAFSTLRFGVHVDGGSLDADGYSEILTAAGPGAVFGAAVRAFDYDGTAVVALQKVNFLAYASLAFGAEVAVADVDGDSIGEILTGPGPSIVNPSEVRGFDYDGVALTAIAGLDFTTFGNRYGIRVAGGEVDADGADEILVMPADPALPARARGFDFAAGATTPIAWLDFLAGPTASFGGDIDAADLGI